MTLTGSKSLLSRWRKCETLDALLKLGIIDEIVDEPLGGAHRDRETIALEVKNSIIKNLKYFENLSRDEVYDNRKIKFLKIGRERGFSKSASLNNVGLGYKESYFDKVRREINKNQYLYYGLIAFLLVIITIITVV